LVPIARIGPEENFQFLTLIMHKFDTADVSLTFDGILTHHLNVHRGDVLTL
jgi:hypothetical protein